jgi:hypothetical protein
MLADSSAIPTGATFGTNVVSMAERSSGASNAFDVPGVSLPPSTHAPAISPKITPENAPATVISGTALQRSSRLKDKEDDAPAPAG